MSYLKPKNPYSPGYALPENVLTEPKTRGTVTTNWAPRGTIDSYRAAKPRSAWASGYALPKNVLRETPGQGVLTTNWAPKGTIDSYVSPTMRTPLPADVEDRGGLQVLEGLYEAKIPGKPAVSKDDVIGRFGRQAAREIIKAAQSGKTPEERIAIVKGVLSSISPSLRTEVENKAKKLQAKRRMPALEALEKALAMAFANHLAEQWRDLGEGRKPKGLLSVDGVSWEEMYGSRDLGFSISGAWDKIKDAGSTVVDKTKEVASKIKEYSCKAANHPTAPLVAGAATTIGGGSPQTGMQGAQTAQQICAIAGQPAGGKPSASSPSSPARGGFAQYAGAVVRSGRAGYAAGQTVSQGGAMSTNTKIVLGVGAVAAVGALVYMAKRK